MRETFDVQQALLELGEYFENPFRLVFGPAALGYLRSFRVRAANESDGTHFEHIVLSTFRVRLQAERGLEETPPEASTPNREPPLIYNLPGALILIQLPFSVLIDRVLAFGRHDVLG